MDGRAVWEVVQLLLPHGEASGGVVSSGVTLIKECFCDFNGLGAGTWPCRGRLSSMVCLNHSVLLATVMLMSGWATPARMYN